MKKLREVFAYFGLPNQIVSDNGPAFIAEEFQQFMRINGVQHIRSAPYHPQTNGEAERFVQTFKRAMKADDRHVTDEELDRRLQQFLLKYRVTPHATTGRTPAELFLNRKPTTVLDRLRPHLRNEVERRVQGQRRERLEKGQQPKFNVGDRVYARFWYGSRRWRKGRIVALAGPLSYDVQVDDDVHRRHASQLFHDRAERVLEGEGEHNLDEFAEPKPPQAGLPKSVSAPPVQDVVVAPPPPEPKSQMPPTTNVAFSPKTTPASPPKAAPQKIAPLPPPKAKEAVQPPARAPSTRERRQPKRFDDEFAGLGSSCKN